MHLDWNYILHQSPARIVAIAAFVSTTLQYLKRFTPLLSGWWAIAMNVCFSAALVLAATNPDRVFTPETIANVMIAALGAAGIHGTGRLMFGQEDERAKFDPRAGKLPVLMLVASIGVMTLGGCTSWERQTYQTLAATQAAVNQAQDDYESGALPHTQPIYAAVNRAKDAQRLAVHAFAAYAQLKDTKGSQTALEAQQQLVSQALSQLPQLIVDVRALYVSPPPVFCLIPYTPGSDVFPCAKQ